MTVKEYISTKFQSFGISLSEADLVDISLSGNVVADADVNSNNKRLVEMSICRFIPALLLRPQSISENGFSVSYNADAIKDYYSFLCKQYGIEDMLNPRPTVTFY